MNRISSSADLQSRQQAAAQAMELQDKRVVVCCGTGCVSGGSLKIYDRLKELCEQAGLSVGVELGLEPGHKDIGMKKSGCNGFCEMGPLLHIQPLDVLYTKVKLDDCEEIFEKSLKGDEVIDRLLYKKGETTCRSEKDIPFYKLQTRNVLEFCGESDATDLNEYIARGGYQALNKAIFEMTPQQVCEEIEKSGLRGRGGAGFPTGRKWKQVLRQAEPKHYVVCNGDEGDPGAFMDRSVMEGDPHKMIEGMIIAAYATKSDEGYIYVRAEYPLAVERLQIAIEKATEAGLLGDNILGSGFSFRLHINKGAGAFVCGEGSALTASIEGGRGMPRVKPPRTVEKGLFDKPTVLNNVETYANVAKIIMKGSDWFRTIGTQSSPGTKAFALTGNVVNTGLIEVPMGTTLETIIFDIGGGIRDGKNFKAVQIGGPSGGCLCKPEHLKLPLDFDSLQKIGAMIGSGGLVVMDEDTCMVEVARFFMNFTQNESCGKCVPCREGTKRMLEILEKIVAGKGTPGDIALLEELADTVTNTALCGLGKTAANPVISTLQYFRDEYDAHVIGRRCPAKACSHMKRLVINPEACKGCTKCARNCPVNAITGTVKNPHEIDNDKCIKCGTCIDNCKFGAIEEVW
ncbi:MAG: NADH-quinone oxidoreductase subunit NuoF [Blautia sp.]|nr:NADH-quinone oxidoreductase subunit NuoF [Blautia sp.]